MHKCCTLNQTQRTQRRTNGLQLPLNYLQVLGWTVLVITGVLNFVILVEVQIEKQKTAAQIVYVILYVAHIASHLTASLLDPSEEELRKLEVNTVPEFDRNIHAHVIENGRCHICNIYTSSKMTKHCSLCNKCVDRFDHHCKWLNSCVGRRNYGAFIASVVTALLLSLMTSLLCLVTIILFIANPHELSPVTQDVINCSSITNLTNTSHDNKFCRNSILFVLFLIILCGCALAIACALIHLFCFHIYISILGVSTYEYIIRGSSGATAAPHRCNCCRFKLPGKLYVISKSKTNNNLKSEEGPAKYRREGQTELAPKNSPASGDRNVASFIGTLVNNELDKAKRIFIYDKNKIHPQEENS